MGRAKNAQIARETIEILEKGFYINPKGKKIPIREESENAKQNTTLYRPETFSKIFGLRKIIAEKKSKTIFEVKNETTLSAAKRLNEEGYDKVLALNFASAKNPGGGFLTGASAQEESLARASSLYPCIVQMQEMYQYNRQIGHCFYSDYMIESPQVPVFRNDEDELLEKPYLLSFLTAPAVNAGVVWQKNLQSDIDRVETVMIDRTEKVLSIAKVRGYKALVLGAWGCGVFRNDPEKVASYFWFHLLENPVFKDYFEKIIFSVLDNSVEGRVIKPFQEKFADILI